MRLSGCHKSPSPDVLLDESDVFCWPLEGPDRDYLMHEFPGSLFDAGELRIVFRWGQVRHDEVVNGFDDEPLRLRNVVIGFEPTEDAHAAATESREQLPQVYPDNDDDVEEAAGVLSTADDAQPIGKGV